jgi:hypothetical protein
MKGEVAMSNLVLQSTPLAQWYALINEAENHLSLQLDEAQESYLVFLLIRFMQRPEWAEKALALDFFQTIQLERGQRRFYQLQELGDKCLLFAGLFPEQSKRKRVQASYFVDVGRTAFSELIATDNHFAILCDGFQRMIDVLQATRRLQYPLIANGAIDSASAVLTSFPLLTRH